VMQVLLSGFFVDYILLSCVAIVTLSFSLHSEFNNAFSTSGVLRTSKFDTLYIIRFSMK